MMDEDLKYFVMDDTTNNIDFDELALFEASFDPKTKKEIERKAAKILAPIKLAVA